MDRVPFKICVMRFVGTLILRASSAALIESVASSSARCSPGWIVIAAITTLPISYAIFPCISLRGLVIPVSHPQEAESLKQLCLLTFAFCSLYCGAVEENGNGPCIEQQARIKWRPVPLPYTLSRAGRHPLNLAPASVLTGSVYERLCRIRIPHPESRRYFAAHGVHGAFTGK